MTDYEKYNLLTSDLQLTRYSENAWKGKPGSLWYVSRYNAICLLSNSIRRNDPLNKCGIHEDEYKEAYDNIIVQGYIAFTIRNNTPNLACLIPEADEQYVCYSERVDCNIDEYDAYAAKVNDSVWNIPRSSNKYLRELAALYHFHEIATDSEIEDNFQLEFRSIDSSVVLYILRNLQKEFATTDLSEQMGLHGRKILCHIDGVTYREIDFYQRKGMVPYISAHRFLDNEYNIQLCNTLPPLVETGISHGYMGCLLNYCAYKSLLKQMLPVYSGPLDYAQLYTLILHAISATAIHIAVDNKKELADQYISMLFPEIKARLLRAPDCFAVTDEKVMEYIYRENRRWIKEDALRSYLPGLQHKMLMDNCNGFLRYMRNEYPYLEEVEASYEDAQVGFLWPLYTASATDDDKQTFEDYLRKLCASKKKSLTKDIKNYLKAKSDVRIISRPEQQNTEYDIIKRFGYPFGEKAYYAAN